MPHVDPDRLVLLALGETAPDPTESGHIAQCTGCRDDLDATRKVAEIGRHAQDLADLPAPPPRVWRRIAATTGVDPRPAPEITPAPARARRSRWPSRLRVVALAATAAAAAVAVTLAVPKLLDRQPAERVAATAGLAAVPTARTDAAGTARVLDGADGVRMHLHVTGLPLRPGYYEVWLIDPDSTRMVSIGVLRDGGDELLPLPATIDLRRYRLVDVSAEEYDGDVTHSGQSLLRGTLAG